MRRGLMLGAVLLLLAAACNPGPQSAKGFRLPDGNVEKGKLAFLSLKCNACHQVDGVEMPPPGKDVDPVVVLGGEFRRVRTYGQLVTSIINPSHDLAKGYAREKVSENGKSKMAEFNDTMTVRQLTDIVTFLQPRYKIKEPEYDYYPYGP